MTTKHSSKPRKLIDAAKKQVNDLFSKAKTAFKTNPKLANECIRKARKAAMKVKLRFPRHLKRQFCKHCYSYLMPGKNCRIRTSRGKVVYYCLNCKRYMRFPYKK